MNNTINSAEAYLQDCIRDGLAHSYDVITNEWVKPYPEVTGYLLSYFAENNNIQPSIIEACDNLINIQDKSGGFPSFYNKKVLYTFDTAQIMHGFTSIYQKTTEEKYLRHAIRCADFVSEMQVDNGAMFPMFDLNFNARYTESNGTWGSNFSFIQVKNIEGFLLLDKITGENKYKNQAEKLAQWGKNNCDVTFTHPGAYCLEGLLAIGEYDFAANVLKTKIIPRIQDNGFLSYSPELPYSYVSGSVQMGILLFKTGFKEEAGKILEWAKIVQSKHKSGGLFQYADKDGNLDNHVHTEINSWGTKYFAQLERLFLCTK